MSLMMQATMTLNSQVFPPLTPPGKGFASRLTSLCVVILENVKRVFKRLLKGALGVALGH